MTTRSLIALCILTAFFGCTRSSVAPDAEEQSMFGCSGEAEERSCSLVLVIDEVQGAGDLFLGTRVPFFMQGAAWAAVGEQGYACGGWPNSDGCAGDERDFYGAEGYSPPLTLAEAGTMSLSIAELSFDATVEIGAAGSFEGFVVEDGVESPITGRFHFEEDTVAPLIGAEVLTFPMLGGRLLPWGSVNLGASEFLVSRHTSARIVDAGTPLSTRAGQGGRGQASIGVRPTEGWWPGGEWTLAVNGSDAAGNAAQTFHVDVEVLDAPDAVPSVGFDDSMGPIVWGERIERPTGIACSEGSSCLALQRPEEGGLFTLIETDVPFTSLAVDVRMLATADQVVNDMSGFSLAWIVAAIGGAPDVDTGRGSAAIMVERSSDGGVDSGWRTVRIPLGQQMRGVALILSTGGVPLVAANPQGSLILLDSIRAVN